MRLMNLDTKIIVPIEDETKGGMVYEVQMTVAELFEKFLPDFQPEVVDAIPVEWIQKQVKEYPNTYWGSWCMHVLHGWRREQEVR